MFCTKCGMGLQEGWSSCPSCGNGIHNDDVSYEKCEKQKERDIQMEITGGELTVSGQKRFASDIHIYGNQVMIKTYMNTKKYSEPVINEFSTDMVSQIRYVRHPAVRKIHKIRYVSGGVVFIAGVLSGLFYFCFLSLLMIGFNYWNSLWNAIEIGISDGRKIYIYYSDKDDAVQIESELKRRI